MCENREDICKIVLTFRPGLDVVAIEGAFGHVPDGGGPVVNGLGPDTEGVGDPLL